MFKKKKKKKKKKAFDFCLQDVFIVPYTFVI